MLKKNILFVSGINDKAEVKIERIKRDGLPNYMISGSTNLHSHLQNDHFDISFVILDTRQNQEVVLNKTDVIFNQVSDADTHTVALEKVENISHYYGNKVPVLNKPEDIRKTQRDTIYTLLQRVNRLKVPKTVRLNPKTPSDIYRVIEDEDFSFPVIFRKAGDHGGVSTLLIENRDEYFHAFCLNGEPYYLTEFVDYKNKDGLYIKYRLIVVDGELFLRHVMYGKEWLLHNKNQLEMIEERIVYSKRFNTEVKPAIQPIISDIHEHLGLDYFGMDCHIDDEMNILVFEINANMNVFAMAEATVFKEHLEAIRKALISMIMGDPKRIT